MYSELQMKPNQHKCKIDNEKTLTMIINISTGRMSCLMQERKKNTQPPELIMQLTVNPFTASVRFHLNYMCRHSQWDSQLS